MPLIFGCRPLRLTSPRRFFVEMDAKVVANGVEVDAGTGGVGVVTVSLGLFAICPFQLVTTGTAAPPPLGLPTIPNLRLFPDWDRAASGFPFPTPIFASSPKSDPPSPASFPPFESSSLKDFWEIPEVEFAEELPVPGIGHAGFIIPLQTLQVNVKFGWVNSFSRTYDSVASGSHWAWTCLFKISTYYTF